MIQRKSDVFNIEVLGIRDHIVIVAINYNRISILENQRVTYLSFQNSPYCLIIWSMNNNKEKI